MKRTTKLELALIGTTGNTAVQTSHSKSRNSENTTDDRTPWERIPAAVQVSEAAATRRPSSAVNA